MRAPAWLIESKLAPPVVPADWIPRHVGPAGTAGPALTRVSPGPGWGKTLALSAWLGEAARSGTPTLWLSLDATDGDVATFFEYLTFGLGRVAPAAAATLAAALAAGRLGPRACWTRLFEAAGADGLALALDDVHHLHAADPEILRGLAAAVEHAPAGVHVVMSSRRKLAFGLPRLQVRGLARLIEQDRLALDASEAARLTGMPAELAARRTEALDGWPLGLAALRTGAESQLTAGFVAEELVRAQPPARRAFMVRAALLDEVTVAACREVFGDEDAAAHLSALEAEMLVQRLEGAGWRFPGYMAGWLREEAARTLAPEALVGWHEAAAAFHRAAGADERALPHYMAVGDWRRALACGERCFPHMRHAGRTARIARLIAGFPAEAAAEPALALWRAHVDAEAGRLDEALAGLGAARAGFAERGDAEGAFKALVRHADLALLRGDEAGAATLLRFALAAQADGRAEDVVDLHFVRGRAAELRGDLALMAACNEAVLAVAAGDNVEVAASHGVAHVNLFTCAWHRGELARARRHAEDAITLAGERRFGPLRLLGGFLRAQLDLVEGELSAADAFLAGLPADWADRLGWFDQALARSVIARRHELAGEPRLAETELRRSWALFARAGHHEGLKVPLEGLLWLAARQGRPERADALLGEACGDPGWPGPRGPRNLHDAALVVPLARLRRLAGDAAGAAALLDRALPELRSAGARLHLVRALLVQASVRRALGDDAAARGAADEAMRLIEAWDLGFLRSEDPALEAEIGSLLAPRAAAQAPAPPAGLSLRLFGGFEARLGDQPIDGWSRKKSKWALAALLMSSRGLSAVELAEALGGLDHNSLASVKMAVSGVRKAIEPGADHSERFIRLESERYQLRREAVREADVLIFDEALRRAERAADDMARAAAYEAALGVYGGDLLPEAGDFFTAEREGYRQRALAAALWLAGHHAALGDPAAVERALRRAIAIAPADEAPYLSAMRHHHTLGRVERVRQLYWDHRRARKQLLGLPPSAAFEAAFAALASA